MTVTLVVPCYNEEVNIQKGVLDKIGHYTKTSQYIKEVLIVDDGSTDESTKMIEEEYLSEYPKFKLIKNPHQGKAIAVITGIEIASSEYVAFCDIDLATPLHEIKKLIYKMESGIDIVIGSRKQERKGAPFTRKLQSVGFTLLRSLLIGLGDITDTQCGFKAFKKGPAMSIISKLQVFTHKRKVEGSSVSAAFDLEFLFLAKKMGYSIAEVPVEWHHAETKNVSFIKDSIETISDLLKIRWYDIKGKYTYV